MQETQETQVRSLGWEDPLEKEMATPSSILAWKIPWTEEPGGLQLWGCKDLDTTKRLNTNTHTCKKLLKYNILYSYVICKIFCFPWLQLLPSPCTWPLPHVTSKLCMVTTTPTGNESTAFKVLYFRANSKKVLGSFLRRGIWGSWSFICQMENFLLLNAFHLGIADLRTSELSCLVVIKQFQQRSIDIVTRTDQDYLYFYIQVASLNFNFVIKYMLRV